MEQAKLANGRGHRLPIEHSPSSARKKAEGKKTEFSTAATEGYGQQVEIIETGLPLLWQ